MVLKSVEHWEKRAQLSEVLSSLTNSNSHSLRIMAETEHQICRGHIPWPPGPSSQLLVSAARYVRGLKSRPSISHDFHSLLCHTYKRDKLLRRVWKHWSLACVSQLELRDTDTRPFNSCDFYSLYSQTGRCTAGQGMKALRHTSRNCIPACDRRPYGLSAQAHRLWIMTPHMEVKG
jgi:hypothetical protein